MTPRTETVTFYGGPLAFLATLTALEPAGVQACFAGLLHVIAMTWWMGVIVAGVACLAVSKGARR